MTGRGLHIASSQVRREPKTKPCLGGGNLTIRQAGVKGDTSITDLGDEVHLRIDQRVPWSVAFEILKILKRA